MAKAKNKTQETKSSPVSFLNKITDQEIRDDCFTIMEMMKSATKEEPKMWGPSIIGFGKYHYKYESGREGDSMLIGFSPRKQNITLYIMSGSSGNGDLLKKLGKHKVSGGSCIYINKLADIDLKVLKELIKDSAAKMKKRSVPKS